MNVVYSIQRFLLGTSGEVQFPFLPIRKAAFLTGY